MIAMKYPVFILLLAMLLSCTYALDFQSVGTNVYDINTSNATTGTMRMVIYASENATAPLLNTTCPVINGTWDCTINSNLTYGLLYWAVYQIDNDTLFYNGTSRLPLYIGAAQGYQSFNDTVNASIQTQVDPVRFAAAAAQQGDSFTWLIEIGAILVLGVLALGSLPGLAFTK